ncbi:Phospholipid/glycerol acyltransferase family protein [Euphorbia peplus]|nr:Phospholipid/glycerol acyltransferase family protein [Euphorbia peplus]
MEWAGRSRHMRGIPRKMVIMTVAAFAKTVSNVVNTTYVHNADTLLHLVRSRSPGVPLITVSNHMSTLDDPLMWGFPGFPTADSNLARWALAAEDICFKNPLLSYFFRLGKCIPITRGGGIYQEHMNEALERLRDGAWLHTFPEGKVSQVDAPIGRLKWGTASLIVRAPITPIVLPIVHKGFEEVMPEKYWFGRRPLLPLCNKTINIVVGEPIEFDLPKMRQTAISMSRNLPFSSKGWPIVSHYDLDEAAQICLYTAISEKIQNVMERLRCLSREATSTTQILGLCKSSWNYRPNICQLSGIFPVLVLPRLSIHSQ